jgi:hypothetical protein
MDHRRLEGSLALPMTDNTADHHSVSTGLPAHMDGHQAPGPAVVGITRLAKWEAGCEQHLPNRG